MKITNETLYQNFENKHEISHTNLKWKVDFLFLEILLWKYLIHSLMKISKLR